MPTLLHHGRAAAWLATAALLAVACGPDSLTNPMRHGRPPLAPSADLAPDDDPGGGGGGMLGPVPIPIPQTNIGLGAVPWMGTGLRIPAYSSFIVKVDGSVNVSPNPIVPVCWGSLHLPPYGAEGNYGPLGISYYSQLVVGIGFQYVRNGATGWVYGGISGDGGNSASSDTSFTDKELELWVSRSGLYGEIGGMFACPPAGLYLMNGQQMASVVILDGVLLDVNPKVALVKKGTKVEFRASASDGTAITQADWLFVPGSTGVPGGICGGNPCTVTAEESGTIRVSRLLKGRMRSAKAAIQIYTSFKVEASENEIEEGDEVIFTPLIDGEPGTAARWEWRGDDGTVVRDPCTQIVGGKCEYTPAHSGTMWAFTSTDGGDSDSAPVTVKSHRYYISFDSHAPLVRPSVYALPPSSACSIPESTIAATDMGVTITEGTTPGGRPVKGMAVELTLQVAEGSGGHLAHAGKRPLGSFAPGTEAVETKTVTTDANGHASFEYYPPEFAGSYWVQADAAGSLAADVIGVGVALQPLPRSPDADWLPYGEYRDKHADVYNGLPAMNENLLGLARGFRAAFDKKLYFNDESLPAGGRFDAYGGWTNTDHCSHRWGNGLDLHAEATPTAPALTEVEMKYVRYTWMKLTKSAKPPLFHKRHYHLQLPQGR